jgi:hypoxanthine phosphoribosyltransferase
MFKNLKPMYQEEELQKRIKEVAEEIDKDYVGKEIVVVCVLKGAVFFTVDLVKKMKTPIELETVQISSYLGTESTGEITMKKDLDNSIEGRDVLIVEDIVDSGRTLKYLKDYLLEEKKAKSVKIAVLMDKKERRIVDVNIDYTGFVIPNKFVVGYGFDVDEKGRNIPYVGYLDE